MVPLVPSWERFGKDVIGHLRCLTVMDGESFLLESLAHPSEVDAMGPAHMPHAGVSLANWNGNGIVLADD